MILCRTQIGGNKVQEDDGQRVVSDGDIKPFILFWVEDYAGQDMMGSRRSTGDWNVDISLP